MLHSVRGVTVVNQRAVASETTARVFLRWGLRLVAAIGMALFLGWVLNKGQLAQRYGQYSLAKKQVQQLTEKNRALEELLEQKRWEIQPDQIRYLEWQARQRGLVRNNEFIEQIPIIISSHRSQK